MKRLSASIIQLLAALCYLTSLCESVIDKFKILKEKFWLPEDLFASQLEKKVLKIYHLFSYFCLFVWLSVWNLILRLC